MNANLAVVNGRVVVPDGLELADLMIADGRIDAIGQLPDGWTGGFIDASQMLVAPGFIDLQINGGHGADFTTDSEAIWQLAKQLPQYGVTAFLPTIVSSPPDSIENALRTLAARPSGFRGAAPLGLHLEGPMLNPQRAGAHSVEFLRQPSPALIADWSPESGVTMVTVAPELPGALDVIEQLTARGVTVASGHSEASTDDAAAAVDAGASHVTHLFNAMSPLHHRHPGLVGFTLARDDVTAGLIVDGIHSHPDAIAVAWNAKGSKRLALVTDASAAQGMSDGTYTLGANEVTVTGDTVRDVNGTLAGTNLTMSKAIRNLIAFTGCDPIEAINAATATPARIIGVNNKGVIETGRDADIVLLDRDLRVALTMIGGRTVYDPHNLT